MDIKCTQCGGQVPIQEDTAFVRCPFCETALYVETDRTVSHQYVPAGLAEKDLEVYLKRQLAQYEYVGSVELKKRRLAFFPFWRFDLPTGKSIAVPAGIAPYDDLRRLKMPAGSYKLFDPAALEPHEVIEPAVLLEDAAEEARAECGNEEVKFTGAALVHLPFFLYTYAAGSREFAAMTDAAAGQTYADEWPAGAQKNKDRTLGLIAALCVFLFLLEAALLPNIALTLPAYLVTAVGLYYLARSTLTRMGW